jgi:hypothetical protein
MPNRVRTVVMALLASAAATGGAMAQEPAPVVTAPVPVPAPVAGHPSLDTGWARAPAAGEVLYTGPGAASPAPRGVPSASIAGRALGAAFDDAGEVWVRVAFPGGVTGWAPGAALVAVPPPPELAAATRRALVRATASLGRASALVVRDRFGRTVFAAGTTAPLSIASVTKLATVAAALAVRPMPLRAASAILGPSDNDRAQALSTRVGGGSARLGARRAVETAAALGADLALVDGSGLSPANRASAGEIADLLLGVRDTPGFRTLFRAMPVAGRSGTLEDRMGGSTAEGRLRAKTGSLFDDATSALAGYVWPHGAGLSPERALVIVALENRVSPYRARPVQDAIAARLTAPGAFVEG